MSGQRIPQWCSGCDVGWHDDCLAIAFPITGGSFVSCCMKCMAEMLDEGSDFADVMAEILCFARDNPEKMYERSAAARVLEALRNGSLSFRELGQLVETEDLSKGIGALLDDGYIDGIFSLTDRGRFEAEKPHHNPNDALAQIKKEVQE